MSRKLAFFGSSALLSLSLSDGVAAPPPSSPPSRSAQIASGAPDVFGSVALPVRHSRYDARWTRVIRNAGVSTLGAPLRPARSAEPLRQAKFVNALVNRTIEYRFDAQPGGDHWATAQETIASSRGDCEDFVIAKMQALRSLGMPAEHLYMTIGNDVAAGAVHAVLLVRIGSSFWVLDNRTDRLLPQEAYKDFHPILTFSGSRTWLHGYKPGTMPAAVRAMQPMRMAQLAKLPIGNSSGSANASRSNSP